MNAPDAAEVARQCDDGLVLNRRFEALHEAMWRMREQVFRARCCLEIVAGTPDLAKRSAHLAEAADALRETKRIPLGEGEDS